MLQNTDGNHTWSRRKYFRSVDSGTLFKYVFRTLSPTVFFQRNYEVQRTVKERQKEVRNGLIPNHDFKRNLWLCFLLFYTDETLKRLKKFTTLLPNNWLAETPQPHAVQTVGGKGADF
ncbi:hypothetical protein P4576_19515 [Peribacillus frigoritolerans]|uniref:hypothetical protein n=1 Tax=Peribacillus frigoritolerans TaxID=450367 RepID=UPI002E24ABB4|nr:hypothetical protein [Peribacillus frigoritolerans]